VREEETGMKVYLLRHGRPKRETEDPARPLSDAGRREVEQVASSMALSGVRPSVVRHSGKLRASQTADIISLSLSPAGGCRRADGLKPLDDPGEWRARLETESEDLMLVGHLPHLDLLASSLLGCGVAGGAFDFTTAGAACLERAGLGRWVLTWFLRPGVLRSSPGESPAVKGRAR
jgi:phosphohistidine phosphatase